MFINTKRKPGLVKRMDYNEFALLLLFVAVLWILVLILMAYVSVLTKKVNTTRDMLIRPWHYTQENIDMRAKDGTS